MEGSEGPPKKSLGQHLARIPETAKKIYMSLVPGGEVKNADKTVEGEEDEPGIELGDVAWAIDALRESKRPVVNSRMILTTLGVGESDKIDYFKKNPDEYSQVNRFLQQLVDAKVLHRSSFQDPQTGMVKISYMVSDLQRLHELADKEYED